MVEPEKEGGYLLAKSKNACSGLLYKVRFDPKQYPLISWKWRVVKFPEKSFAENEVPSPVAKKYSLWSKLIAILTLKPLFSAQDITPKVSLNRAKDIKGGWLEKDDYAARIYVIFPSWLFTNIKSIEYVWDEQKPKGTIMTSPYFTNIKLIVAESGKKDPQGWCYVERNIYEDYKTAFGKSPGHIGAIAIMTDTDNTASTAEAMYTDIKVGYGKKF
jgi:hypothetical protein